MKIENKYHIYLDYKGYMIEPKAARVLPAPLMGNKFSTGSVNYSDLDFWQSAAMTNFTRGFNQKFFSDVNSYWFSTGIDVSTPGEFCLERDIVTDVPLTSDPLLLNIYGKVTASYKTLTHLYVGTSTGYVFSRAVDSSTWVLISAITSDSNPVTGFFEISDQYSDSDKYLYVCKGEYKGWILIDSEWMQLAPIIEWAPSLSNLEGVKLGNSGTLTKRKIAQSFILRSNERAKRFSIAYKTIGNWTGDVTVNIHLSDPITGAIAADSIIETFTVTLPKSSTMTWFNYDISDTAKQFVLSRCDKFFIEIVPLTAANDTACPEFGCTIGRDSYYEGDTLIVLDPGEDNYAFAVKGEQLAFKIWSDLPTGVSLVSSQGFSAFGWVDNGIKSTANGVLWSPDSSKGLWTLPASQGKAKALGRTGRGTIVGGASSLWLFVGGSSAMNLWDFPDYINDNNFRGFHEWNNKIIFSIENQGIFMTDGSTVGQSNLNNEREAFKFISCNGITTSGWDAFALCKNDKSEWYLLRSNAYYDGSFIYWWAVKKLSKEPTHIASLNVNTILIFNEDKSIDKYCRNGTYQSTGYLETSLFDAGLIKLDKLYKDIEVMFEPFETDTSCSIGYRTSIEDNYTTSEVFTSSGKHSVLYPLYNPTSGNRFQVKVTLNSNPDKTKTPICSDIVWSYILQRSANEKNTLKTFYVTIICEPSLENNIGDVEFINAEGSRSSKDILNDLWELSQKREVLNYIGMDNESNVAFKLEYNGEKKYTIKIDRTNYLFSILNGTTVKYTFNYRDKTTNDIVDDLNERVLAGDTEMILCSLVDPFKGTESVNMLEPIKDVYLTNETYLNIGTDVRAVLLNPQSPSQIKISLDKYGRDRIQLNLREAN